MYRNFIVHIFIFTLLVSTEALSLKIGGTGAALSHMQYIADAYEKRFPEQVINVPINLGTNGSIRAVLSGALDIAMTARPLNEKEAADGLWELAYAKTPFVFVSSKLDISTSLSSELVKEIYLGQMYLWEDATPVRLILRPSFHNDSVILESFLPGMAKALARARKRRVIPTGYTDLETLDLAERVPGSFTTASLTSVVSESRRLKVFSLNGVNPTVQNIVNGKYPLVKTLYIVFKKRPSDDVKSFLEFMHSMDAKIILRSLGNYPLLDYGGASR